MPISIAHLGPAGTNTEAAALLYAQWWEGKTNQVVNLCPYPSISQTLEAVANAKTELAVVPVENSIGGSVAHTLDGLWHLDKLRLQQEIVLPIFHVLLSRAESLEAIETIYSHPQALAQCQEWLEKWCPTAQLIPTSSTTEALQHLGENPTVGAISSERAAQLYNLPVLASGINDHPDNCTRFWILSLQPSPGGNHTSIAFTVHDAPGALLKPLQVFADRGINLSRIESRPTKRSLGDYLFFVDLEADAREETVQLALTELVTHTTTLKVFGSYEILELNSRED
jgi:prephenate dehydratase